MKAKVALFKMRVKEASKILSVNDIYSWEKLENYIPEFSDITLLPDEAGMENMSFMAIRVVNISVN
jgi:hypothetical protein